MKNHIYLTTLCTSFLIATTSIVYSQAGSLDLSFSTDGIVVSDIAGFDDEAEAVAIQSDGKIIIVGKTDISASGDFVLVRYNVDGSIDNSFDTDGMVTTDFSGTNDKANSVVIQSDGKIVVAGVSFNGSGDDFALSRYNIDGSLDNTFDTDGKVTTSIGTTEDFAYSCSLQTDNKIVVSGYTFNGASYDFVTVRYNSNGSLDNTFDTDGIVTTALGAGQSYGYSVIMQTDGKILVSGEYNTGSSYDFAVVRYNSNGSLDNTFDTDGIVTTDLGGVNDYSFSVALQSDGKIVVCGYSFNGSDEDIAVVRYNANGSIDNTFSTDGIATTPIGTWHDYSNSVAIQSDGKILVGGYSETGTGQEFAVVRFNSDGTLDNSFDTDGIITTPIGTAYDYAMSMILQTDGKIILAGYTDNGSDYDIALVRYNNDLTGIDENDNNNAIIYPNPVRTLFTLSLDKDIIDASLKLIDECGRIVLQKQNLSGSSFVLDISEQESGIYFLQLKYATGTVTKKIIKQ